MKFCARTARRFLGAHEVARYEEESGVPFHRIWFGVDALRFRRACSPRRRPRRRRRTNDLGFTGVIRGDQTNNWRAKIWGLAGELRATARLTRGRRAACAAASRTPSSTAACTWR